MSIFLILIFSAFVFYLSTLKKKRKSFNYRVLSALVIGLVFGAIVNIFVQDKEAIQGLVVFMSIFGKGYVTLLKMIVIPLIFVAMITAITNSGSGEKMARIAPKVIGVLVATVIISAIVGIMSVFIFDIDGNTIVNATAGSEDVAAKVGDVAEKAGNLDKNYAEHIVGIIPTNIFATLSGQGTSATLSVVLLAMFTGFSVLQVKKRREEAVLPFMNFMNSLKEVVLSMVREILKLTPYGIVALMATFTATNSLSSLAELGKFLLASYAAIIFMYLIHLIILRFAGLSPITFAKKSWSVLLFGFGSRSSMAALPLNITTQEEMGVDETTANISASFGTSIGQNGCAGIYPAMLAVMAAQISGVEMTLTWFIVLAVVTAISSFGIAGVGGGATFAAIAVLSIMGLDITIAAVLVSIEPLIDMARTALNISDSMLTGLVVAKSNKTLDLEKFNS